MVTGTSAARWRKSAKFARGPLTRIRLGHYRMGLLSPIRACSMTPMNAWHTCPGTARSAANPCSRIHVPGRYRLQPCLDEPASVQGRSDEETTPQTYVHASRLWTIPTLEISVLMAQFPSKIAQRSYDFRTLGLGYANLGGLLMNVALV